MEKLEDLLSKLIKQGYEANIPANSKEISVSGYKKGKYSYKPFNAKKAKAATILAELVSLGYNARTEKFMDGYYDFYVSAPKPSSKYKPRQTSPQCRAAGIALKKSKTSQAGKSLISCKKKKPTGTR